MPLKSGEATEQERVLAARFAASGDVDYSGAVAGYSRTSSAARALARPAVAAEVARVQLARIQNELLPLAVDAHVALLTGAGVPAGARVQAVKLAYDRAFGVDSKDATKEPHEYTGAELGEAIRKLEREKAERARPIIDAAPEADSVFG